MSLSLGGCDDSGISHFLESPLHRNPGCKYRPGRNRAGGGGTRRQNEKGGEEEEPRTKPESSEQAGTSGPCQWGSLNL